MSGPAPLSGHVTALSRLIDREARLIARKVQSGALSREEAERRLLEPCEAMLVLAYFAQALTPRKQAAMLAYVGDTGRIEAAERLAATIQKLEAIG